MAKICEMKLNSAGKCVISDYKKVREFRKILLKHSLKFGFSDKESYQIGLIFEELGINGLRHGAEKDPRVIVEYTFGPSGFELSVKNKIESRQVNMKSIVKRNLRYIEAIISEKSKRKVKHGLGLVMVQKFSDKFHVNIKGDEFIAHVTKKRKED